MYIDRISYKRNRSIGSRFYKQISKLLLLLLMLASPIYILAQTVSVPTLQNTLSDAGLDANKVYTIHDANGHQLYVSSGSLTANNTYSLETASNNTAYQFAFVPDPIDNSKFYLYNIAAGGFLSPSKSFGVYSAQPIYIYRNASYIYLAFSNAVPWSTSGESGTSHGYYIIGGTASIDDWHKYDGRNMQLTATEIPNATYDLSDAQSKIRFTLKGDFHSLGHTKRPLMANGMGDVAEVHYYYYVNPNQGSDDGRYNNRGDVKSDNGIVLQLPFYDYFKDPDNGNMNGNNTEPNAYFRWYDYTTDGMPTKTETISGVVKQRLTPWSSGNVRKVYDKNGKDLGIFFYNIGNINPNATNVGVIYNIPDSAQYADWKGDVIGCDVSRYYDYNDSPTPDRATFTHEPTLSVRYVFHILPAKKLADDMEQNLIRAKSDSLTLQDHALLVFGAKGDSATMNLRTQFSRLKDYWFHPYTGTASVYHKASQTGYSFANNGSFSDDLKRATGTEWRVYNADSTAYRVFASTTADQYGTRPGGGNKRLQDRDLDISLNREVGSGMNTASDGISQGMRIHSLNGTGWKNLAGADTTVQSIKINDECFIVGYVTNGNDKCPFFNCRLEINHLYPMSDEQINNKGLTERTPEYLQNRYGSPVATFSFDNEDSSENTNAPTSTTSEDNFDLMPSPFSERQYGFVYWDLQQWTSGLWRAKSGIEPLHGDYQIMKSLNVTGRSGSVVVNDRTHATDPSRYGYFFYTDASQESRQIGYQDFDGNLCAGSQIIISAYVLSCNNGATQSQPELRFSLYGLDKDADGNVRSEKLFATICSGSFRSNIDGYWNGSNFDAGTWYQVFGAVTLPTGVGIDNYNSFRVTIDNYCNDTNGADYAIDDIRVYQNNSKLSVSQDPALCSATESSDKVYIKIKGNYNILREVSGAEAEQKTVHYRFVRADGSAVTGENFYGEGHNDYGDAIVPSQFDSNAKVNVVNQFETNAAGQRELVLAFQGFNLKQDSTYYVSLNYGEPDRANSWGRINAICSMYSSTFELVRQKLVVNNVEDGNIIVTVPCGKDTTGTYRPINVGLTAPDKVNGGKTILTNVHFDWFNGTRAQYEVIKDDNDSTLAGAVDHYRAVYSTGAYDANNATEQTATNGMVYSAADKALIEKYRYDHDTKPDGILWMSGETSLSKAPLSAGRDTILAIPIEYEVLVSDTIHYDICPDPVEILVRGLSNGPGLDFGLPGINYPSSEPYRSIRLGLPQIKAMGETGVLRVPIARRRWQDGIENNEDLRFVDSNRQPSKDVYIVSTNDPTLQNQTVKIAELQSDELPHDATTANLCKIDASKLHEGYYYEVGFQFLRTDGITEKETDPAFSQCVGETFLTLKIVPEYLTWNPTADNGLNSNWNNDDNWRRSTASELCNASYTDYRYPTYTFQLHDAEGNAVGAPKMNVLVDTTLVGSVQPNTYVPMYFSKVIIPELGNRPYPMLSYISHQEGTNLVINMINDRQYAPTTNIRFDMEAAPDSIDSTSFNCTVFDGNVCGQVYFKNRAQLRNEQFLKYQRAWTEIELPVNTWGTFTTPMRHTLAADMYVPKVSARQQTPLFRDMHYDDVDAVDENGIPTTNGQYGLYGKAGDTMYNRLRMPTYQKLWGENASMHRDNGSNFSSYDTPYIMLVYPEPADGDMSMHEGVNANNFNAWSHTFNFLANQDASSHALNGIYDDAYGLAGKIGDSFTAPSTDVNPRQQALMRLPKADTSFNYYKLDDEGKATPGRETVDVSKLRENNYRLGINYRNVEGDLGEYSITTASLQPEAALAYYYDSDSSVVYINDAHGNVAFRKDIGDYGPIELQADGSVAEADTTSVPNGMIYDLIGNPYTSAISVTEFIKDNRDILRKVERNGQWVYRIWSLIGDRLYEYNDSDASKVIQPGQSFFLMLQHPGVDVVHFTTRMQTDPNISLNTLALLAAVTAPEKVYTLSESSNLTNIINHGIDSQVYCWSPYAGVIAVSGEKISRVEIYNVSGQLVDSTLMSGTERRFSVGSGIYIVKTTLSDGSVDTSKIAVK